jgi:hypothetical protein
MEDLDVNLGGRLGLCGGSICRTVGVDLTETRGALDCDASLAAASFANASFSLFVGGSGGKLA